MKYIYYYVKIYYTKKSKNITRSYQLNSYKFYAIFSQSFELL